MKRPERPLFVDSSMWEEYCWLIERWAIEMEAYCDYIETINSQQAEQIIELAFWVKTYHGYLEARRALALSTLDEMKDETT